MCELLGMSARLPASLTLSLDELARHGGETGPHADGWGIAFYDGPDANLVRESAAAAHSTVMGTLRRCRVESELVLAHIRRANHGPVRLRNTHPFRRDWRGRVHVFAHNGQLPGIFDMPEFRPEADFAAVGETDSELAFCELMRRIRSLDSVDNGLAPLAQRIATVAAFAREIGRLGPANFLYSDGDALFVHGHVRTQPDGRVTDPGLHYISLRCNYGKGNSELAGVTFESDRVQQVTLVSTVPLRPGGWTPMTAGQLLVLRDGAVVHERSVFDPEELTAIDSRVSRDSMDLHCAA